MTEYFIFTEDLNKWLLRKNEYQYQFEAAIGRYNEARKKYTGDFLLEYERDIMMYADIRNDAILKHALLQEVIGFSLNG